MEIHSMLENRPTLETDRLFLRKIKQTDIADIFDYTNRSIFFETMGRPTAFSEEDTRKWVDGFPQKPGLWCIVLKSENKVIGDCGFCQYHEHANRAEISYAVNPDYWNQSYATEAVLSVIRFGFGKLNLNRIQAICNKVNTHSERVLTKVGMTFEGTLRHYIHHEGQPLDMKMYAILKEDWQSSHRS